MRMYYYNGEWKSAGDAKVVRILNQETQQFEEINSITYRHYLDLKILNSNKKKFDNLLAEMDKKIADKTKMPDLHKLASEMIKIRKEIVDYEQRIRKHEAKSGVPFEG